MEKQYVQAAVLVLRSRGEKITTRTVREVLGKGSYRDILECLKVTGTNVEEDGPIEDGDPAPPALMEEISPACALVPGNEHQAGPADDAMVPAAPPTLLGKAETRLREAIAAEHAARRAHDLEDRPQERERLRALLTACQR